MRIDSEALLAIREALDQVHDRLGVIIARLQRHEEFRCLRWRCTSCGHLKHFTRPLPAHVAPPCPKCKGQTFEAMP